ISAISLNNDRNGAMGFLIKVAKSDPDRQLREMAVRRLGRIPGTQPVLADIVRNEQENTDIREAAASALGRNEDTASLTTLQELYGSISNRAVKEQIISSISRHKDQNAAAGFLIKVAESDQDRAFREEAMSKLGRIASQRSLDTLNKIATDSNNDIE